jgi:outer membrane protein OmpA-like peptidoglycan-associated protein
VARRLWRAVDGRAGARSGRPCRFAEVSTAGGKQVLAKSNDMTKVAGAPRAQRRVDGRGRLPGPHLRRALAFEPPPPEKFTLYFETGTTTLTAESARAVAAIVAASHKRRAISIAVSGHTDTAGSTALNERLARDRAEYVRQLLVGQGARIPPDGGVVARQGQSGRAEGGRRFRTRNRRVEVILH